MTNIYQVKDNASSYPRREGVLAERNYFSNCCGASYSPTTPKTVSPTRIKGIRVVGGIVGKERNDDKAQVAHIRTKNGDITILIRKAW